MTEDNTTQQQAVPIEEDEPIADAAPSVKPPLTRPVSPELGKKTPYEGRNKKTTAVAIVCIVIVLVWGITMVSGSLSVLHKLNKDDEPLVVSVETDGSDITLEMEVTTEGA